jgi:type 2 lantibiotic biosynthesis protein LanM
VDVQHQPDAGARLPDSWWAAGLATHERLPHRGGADVAPATADRPSRPDWAGLVERAIALAPGASSDGGPVPVDDWRAAFAVAFRPFLDQVRNEMYGELAGRVDPDVIDLAAVSGHVADHLAHRVVTIAARTFVLELNRARAADRLSGPTPRDRFADFVRQVRTSTGLTTLFTDYPVLARLIGQSCRQAVESTVELLLRFLADRDAIVARLCDGEPGALVGLNHTGDAHADGRTVCLVRFADDQVVVYKPRSLDIHVRFTELARWLSGRIPELQLRTADAVARDGYGWLAFVRHRPAADLVEVNRFYRRQGALLALLYALDGTDVHCENLISCGDQPVLVDVETLFQPVLPGPVGAAADPAAAALSRSVHRSALLPHLFLGDNGAMDISGLGGDRGARYPTDAVRWEAAGTDEMRLVRAPAQFPGSTNRPVLDGREVEPTEHRAALLAGFGAAYQAVIAGRHELVGRDGLLTRCAGAVIRILIRPTRLYAMLLDESTHPDVLRDASARDQAFELLWADSVDDPLRRRLVRSEIADLWRGDVPLFTSRPGAHHVWTAGGHEFTDVLAEPGLDLAVAKIRAMGAVDQRDQEWLITAAMATRSTAAAHGGGHAMARRNPGTAPNRQQLIAATCGLADQIVAATARDGQRANWLGLELVDDRYWAVLPMGAGLGEGYCGVALFLAQLARLTGISRYHEVAVAAIQPMPRVIEAIGRSPELAVAAGCGGFLGLGGVCYALARLAVLLDDTEIRDWLASIVAIMPPVCEDIPSDVSTGLAGGLAAMLAVHAQTGLAEARSVACRYADALLERVESAGSAREPGFARGGTGIGWALLRYSAGDERFASVGKAVLAATVTDGTTAAGRDQPGNGWCSGLAGLMLANLATPDALDPVGGMAGCLARLIEQPPLRDMSLCHGELGVVEALTELAVRGDPRAAAARARRTGQLLVAIEHGGAHCGTPDGVPSPGLLTGLAGLGYGLLRVGFADDVPSVLLLRTD